MNIVGFENLKYGDFDVITQCSKLLRSEDLNNNQVGRSIVIKVLENYHLVPENMKPLWNDLIEAAGFYPYIKKEDISYQSTASNICVNYHQSEFRNDVFYHTDQKMLFDLLMEGKNVIVSAPTSFGKSLLIEEVVASCKYNNIVVIQPTLALLDETRKKLRKYSDIYKIIVRTSQEYSQERNIFLFTAERVIEYNHFPEIDFLVIDEFYKLSSRRDDERADSLNNAFSRLYYSNNPQFYLLGPNIDKISERFVEKNNAVFYKTNFSLVLNEAIDLYTPNAHNFGERGVKQTFKENELFKLLYELRTEQTIIFCSSPGKAKRLAKNFCTYLKNTDYESCHVTLPIIEWIGANIHPKWSMVGIIENGIGVHDGSLPKHFTSSMIEYFNAGKLRFLFCTTTIIEGVNTTSKNIIYFDKTKGQHTPIDYFDYCNIKGRAGRMMVHYTGRIFNFNPIPQEELIEIDIPFVDQNPISDEVLINLIPEDVNEEYRERYAGFDNIEFELRNLIKKNGVSINGQLEIFNTLNSDFFEVYKLISWTGYPTYDQLGFVLNLAWRYLIKPGETVAPMTCSKLTKMTHDYGMEKSLRYLIANTYRYKRQKDTVKTNEDILDESIAEVYQVSKHWFSYKVPKWLSVIHSIQEYICKQKNAKPGDYTFYSNEIENDFTPPHLSLLVEYGIPNTAIRKIENYIPKDIKDEDVIKYILENKVHMRQDLIRYERDKIIESFY